MELWEEAVERYRNGESAENIWLELRERGLKISRSTFYKRLRENLERGSDLVMENEGTMEEEDLLEVTRRVNTRSYKLIHELINRIHQKLKEGDYGYVQHLVDLLFGTIHSFCVSSRVLLEVETISTNDFLRGLKAIAEEIGESFLGQVELNDERDESVVERVRELFILSSNEIAKYTQLVSKKLEVASGTMIRISAKILKAMNELQRETGAILKETNKFEREISIERLLKGR